VEVAMTHELVWLSETITIKKTTCIGNFSLFFLNNVRADCILQVMHTPKYHLLTCWVSYLLKELIQSCCCRISLVLPKLSWIGSSKRHWYTISSTWAFTVCHYQLYCHC